MLLGGGGGCCFLGVCASQDCVALGDGLLGSHVLMIVWSLAFGSGWCCYR